MISEDGKKESYDVSIDSKKGKTNEKEKVEESVNKKKALSSRKVILEDGLVSNTRQEAWPFASYLGAYVLFLKE